MHGPKKELDKFREFARGEEELDFNKFVPYPDEFDKIDRENAKFTEGMTDEQKRVLLRLHGRMKDGFNSGGYEWCINNWGTKWSAYDVKVDENEGSVTYLFCTAWSPPTPVVKAMGQKFPKLKFALEYREPGMGFKGTLIINNGKVEEDWTGEYTSDEQE